MARTANTHGGGAQTNVNGLGIEQTTSLDDALKGYGFSVVDNVVFKNGQRVEMSVQKYSLYSNFLVPNGINYEEHNLKQWLPDECFINEECKTAFIIEKSSRTVLAPLMRSFPAPISKSRNTRNYFNRSDIALSISMFLMTGFMIQGIGTPWIM